MQKKLIAIAVAAALAPAVAMADTTVYGRIHASVDSVTGIALQSEKISVNSNSSRFGVKGNEDLGNGLKAIYQIEATVNANGGTSAGNGAAGTRGGAFEGQTRDTFLGLAGNFGSVKVGRLPGANLYQYDTNLFGDQIGDAALFNSGGISSRYNSAVLYTSPNMSGFEANLLYVPGISVAQTASNTWNGDTQNIAATHGKNSYGIKLNYAANNIRVGGGYNHFETIATNVSTTNKPYNLFAAYDFGQGLVNAQYVKTKTDVGGTNTVDQKVYNIGGKYNVSSNSAIKAQYTHVSKTISTAAENGGKMFALGYDYNFSKRTGMYVAYAVMNNDAAGTASMSGWGHQSQNNTVAVGEDPKGISVGLTHNF